MKGRTENSVKNRYLSLLNLHSFSRKKEKLSPFELRAKIEQKLTELKTQTVEQQIRDRFLALRSEAFINNLPSEDFIKELTEENSEQELSKRSKLNDRHVTFLDDVNMSPLGKFNTKESIPIFSSNRNMMFSAPTGTGSNLGSTPNVFTFNEPKFWLSRPPSLVCKNFSENKIRVNPVPEESKREISLEEGSHVNKGRMDDSLYLGQKSAFYRSLSKSFSKLSMSPKRSPLHNKPINEMVNNGNPEQKSWSKSETQNFSSISSISKKTDNIPKEHSQSSIISLADVHMLPKSFLEKSKSNNDSSISVKERNLLIAALNTLKSEGSSSVSAESMKLRILNLMEEGKQ